MFEFFVKMFGIYVGYSAIRFYFRQNFITNEQLPKIVIAFLTVEIISWVFVENFYLQWSISFVPSALIFLFFYVRVKNLETLFQQEFPDFITALILQMRMGQGFRKSFLDGIVHAPPHYRSNLRFIYDNVVFSPHKNDKKMALKSDFVREIIDEFKKVDQSNHKSIEKLEIFRRRLLIINEFRRRSGRIRGQVHLQAGILSVIYALSFAFVSFTFQMSELLGLIMVSFLLFVAGLLLILLLGRRIRWNI